MKKSFFSNVPEELTAEERAQRYDAVISLSKEQDHRAMLRALRGPVVPVPFELAEIMRKHERQLEGRDCFCEGCVQIRLIARPASVQGL